MKPFIKNPTENNNTTCKTTIKDFFANDAEFIEALDDAILLENLKTTTKYIIELEKLEEKLKKSLKTKKYFDNEVLFVNYKRYLYKHILEIEKLNRRTT